MPTSLLLILTAAGFGASPLLIAEAVAYFPPWTLAALRSALGLPLLILAAGALGPQKRFTRYDLLTALVGGTLVVAIPFVSMAAGMQYIPSGMGGMLYATMPLFTLAMAAMVLPDEPATLEQGMRIGVGIMGVLLISVPAIAAGGFGQAGLGTLLTLISPLSYAAGNVWFRRRRRVAPLMLSAAMFAVGTLAIWPLALLIDGPVAAEPSLTVLGTLGALVVLATVAPNLLNYALVQQAGANRAALAMFLMPAFSVVFGIIFRDERLPLLAFAGLALVIGASTVKLPRWRRAKSALAAEAQGHREVRLMGPTAGMPGRREPDAPASASPAPGPNPGRSGQGAGPVQRAAQAAKAPNAAPGAQGGNARRTASPAGGGQPPAQSGTHPGAQPNGPPKSQAAPSSPPAGQAAGAARPWKAAGQGGAGRNAAAPRAGGGQGPQAGARPQAAGPKAAKPQAAKSQPGKAQPGNPGAAKAEAGKPAATGTAGQSPKTPSTPDPQGPAKRPASTAGTSQGKPDRPRPAPRPTRTG
ncbi:EamA family transporter [Pararhodobacter marinus]|uniref:EamA family transporter n=1 Tax=Pararhodobacter marinus TaxID=2184063 RepID=UPI003511300A